MRRLSLLQTSCRASVLIGERKSWEDKAETQSIHAFIFFHDIASVGHGRRQRESKKEGILNKEDAVLAVSEAASLESIPLRHTATTLCIVLISTVEAATSYKGRSLPALALSWPRGWRLGAGHIQHSRGLEPCS